MVSFDGRALEDISAAIRILDVMVGAPDVNVTTISPALRDGDIFARRLWSPRTVEISFVVLESDTERRSAILAEVAQWAFSTEEKVLRVPQQDRAYLMAFCSVFPVDSARGWGEPVSLTFRASDPYFQADAEKSAQIGTAFTVMRAAGPDWRIEQDVTGTLEKPMWQVEDKQISFASLPAGHLVIKAKDQSATLDGLSVIPSLMLGSRFFSLRKGENTITPLEGAGGTIYWRERWI